MCKKILLILCFSLALLLLFGCQSEEQPPQDEESSSDTTTFDRSQVGLYETTADTRTGTQYFYVKDYGAVGDGETDDGIAVRNAIKDATKYRNGESVIVFEENKTYYCNVMIKGTGDYSEEKYAAVFYFDGASDITVEGNNSRIIFPNDGKATAITTSSNITIKDLSFDMEHKPFVLGTLVTVENKTESFIIETTHPMDLENGTFETTNDAYFALPHLRDNIRNFLTIQKYEELGNNQYRVYPASYDFARSQLSSYGLDTPWIYPNGQYGHSGQVNNISGNTGAITLENINYEASGSFCFHIRGNQDVLNFYNVNLVPTEGYDVEYMVSWRDVFHCKDNRGAITWKDCYIGWAGDDAMNVSDTTCYVTEIDGNSVVFKTMEWSAIPDYRNGETIELYNCRTGEYYGEYVVQSSFSGKFLLDRPIENVEPDEIADIRADNPALAAPGSKIINCNIAGTARYKGAIEIVDTTFDLLVIWAELEIDYEGPIPKDVVFRNCTFIKGGIEMGAFNRAISGSNFTDLAKLVCVTFENCKFEDGARVSELNGTKAVYID